MKSVFAEKNKKTTNSTSLGFTIVELLIVVVVIAILAAITIVSYNGINARAQDTRRSSDIATIAKAIQRWSIETGNDFSAMPIGYDGVRANGWYNIPYTTASFKAHFVSAGYLNNGIDDPVDTKGSPARAYMVVECTSGDTKTRVLLANMQTPQSKTIAQQIGSPACTSPQFTAFTQSYGMDYGVRVTVE